MTEKNIVLIGFMGTGKSSVGKQLAKKMNRLWVDVDNKIEEETKLKISEIFEKKGEPYFRDLERAAIEQVARGKNLVITTGGGAVLDDTNRANLKKNGIVIALWAMPETIYKRVKESRHRPLLKGEDMKASIEKLLETRRSRYEEADKKFDTDGKTAQQVADEILAWFETEEFEFGKDWF
jgi:shikimate kinase